MKQYMTRHIYVIFKCKILPHTYTLWMYESDKNRKMMYRRIKTKFLVTAVSGK